MIYAMRDRVLDEQRREEIARAISSRNRDAMESAVNAGELIHVMDIPAPTDPTLIRHRSWCIDGFFCIYCTQAIWPCFGNGPEHQNAENAWYFRHVDGGNADCVGHRTEINGFECRNPGEHGCYVQMDFDNFPCSQCKVRQSETSYCHYAFTDICRR